ncbi:MAG: enoyl-CoA hydratase-related protein [candidate division WOR-3 bacterium]|nr:enoyl-CoA hydratase-related protein [candidate division WOR-3 bacterium]MCX7946969.1 enoyl-CoA hydratase-related protein [candidate division WOR-3 bacterium]MDW8149990.1 enoyl-CoA hydratase-related protein [candidate division WOR-3 bacterium]
MENYKFLKILQEQDVLYVGLNRPQSRNAFNEHLIEELTHAFSNIPEDILVVILYGEGDSFCAGADLDWMKRMGESSFEENRKSAYLMWKMYETIDSCSCVLISKVHGYVLGGGMGLISCCDIVISEEGAKFGWTEVKLGLVPAVVSTFSIRKVNDSYARRYFLTGEIFDSYTAKHMGLVHEVVKHENLDEKVNEFIKIIRKNGKNGIKLTKQLLTKLRPRTDKEIIDYCIETISRARSSQEALSRINAFLNRGP